MTCPSCGSTGRVPDPRGGNIDCPEADCVEEARVSKAFWHRPKVQRAKPITYIWANGEIEDPPERHRTYGDDPDRWQKEQGVL